MHYGASRSRFLYTCSYLPERDGFFASYQLSIRVVLGTVHSFNAYHSLAEKLRKKVQYDRPHGTILGQNTDNNVPKDIQ